MAANLTSQGYDQETAQILGELLQESLHILLPVTAGLVWVWASGVLLLDKPKALYAYAVLALAVVVVVACHRLSEKRLGLALTIYLGGLALIVTLTALVFRNPAVLYLYMLVVLTAAMLTSTRMAWGVTLSCVAAVLAMSRHGWVAELPDAALPVALILLTALASSVSSRRLFTALAWALSMTEEAQKNADKAQRHRAELRQVLKSLDEAYARLERTNEALIIAQEAAQKAYRFKAEFVANVSHELRTPLNLITGFAQMMATAPESYGGTPLPREFRGDVTAIYQSARHLSDLIDDVLDLSRIEAGRMPLTKEAADLGEIAREAAEMVRGLAEARGLSLELDVPDRLPRLPIDRTRIRQVLLNLLTNATRFTDQGGIRVRIRLEEREAIVTVADSGRGISPEKIAKAFEAFSQLEDDQVREGSGLGLAVSKRFVELHGGRMWVESRMGQGTTITFTIPIPQDEGDVQVPRLIASASRPGPQGEPVVLVVHEDPRVLLLLRRYVEGYRFILAETADQAHKLLDEELPAVVLVDAALAERWASGAAPLRLPARIPQITCPLPSMRRLGLLLGAIDYLPKPVTREALENALSRLPEPPRSVLIVDDNPHVVRLLTRIVKASCPGGRVLKAFGGEQAIEIARADRPDLVLLDLIMPDVTGYDVLRELAENKALAGMRVIVISARSLEDEAAPLIGELRLAWGAGFSLTRMLQMLRVTLPEATALGAMDPGDAAAFPGAQAVQRVW